MVSRILRIFLTVLLMYTVLPYILTSVLGLGVTKKRKSSGKIAITFDDGPNPIYTPVVLDVLKKYDVQATFFVHGSKAAMHPELLLRMQREGHLIGIHNYVHRANWLMSPWGVKKQLDQSSKIIEGITGTKPIYYRPPWGLVNLFYPTLLKDYKIILWSVMARDWKSVGGSERIKNELLTKIKKGDIILLHDNGETFGADLDAPKNTIQALDEVLQELVPKGYQFCRVDE
ncbi:polysaccharide deacetylase family protein [Rummeliibacillus pycnus]|uniref:polysaccharide deacetylase family protein n=1 Tax=Rummeliibacillus pycnus TaxID=101070 RepID=UPI0037C687AC